jgi:hypothetical protein
VKHPVHYCKSWFRAKKRTTELWPAEKAEAAHLQRQRYTALVGSAVAKVIYASQRAGVPVENLRYATGNA